MSNSAMMKAIENMHSEHNHSGECTRRCTEIAFMHGYLFVCTVVREEINKSNALIDIARYAALEYVSKCSD